MQSYQSSEHGSHFPEFLFEHAQTLEHLDLSNNKLRDLPPQLGQFRRLKRLFLTNNCFDSVPAVLAQLPALEMVSFKGNGLRQLPMAALPFTLKWLILTDNQLTELPEDFGRYHRLQKLALAGNQLSHLPESMQQCQQLALCRLSLNRFTTFPDWLFELPRLAWLALGANPATPTHRQHSLPIFTESELQRGRQLGVGASGVIWQARQRDHTEALALKIFKGDVTSDGCPQDELANALHAGMHPHLIPLRGQWRSQTSQGLVMAEIPPQFRVLGQPPSFATISRDTYTDDVRLDDGQLRLLALQAVSALAHLHQRQLCHGDFYAHNMLVSPEWQLYLGDFGAATAIHALSAAQQLAFTKLDVRAVGYWLDDLIQRTSAPSLEVLNWRDRCLQLDVAARPSLAELLQQMRAG